MPWADTKTTGACVILLEPNTVKTVTQSQSISMCMRQTSGEDQVWLTLSGPLNECLVG